MRSDARHRGFTALLALSGLFGLPACNGGGEPAKPAAPEEKISRTDSVKATPKANASAAPQAGTGFCEKLYAPGEKPFAAPAQRPLKGGGQAPHAAGAWTYLNLWATWCKPCVEEMGLFGRWRETLEKDGIPLNVELWSIDAESEGDALRSRVAGGMPGAVHWIASEAAFNGFLDFLGLDKSAAIPIHVLIDPAQGVRCVRVGAIHPEDFAQVKSIITAK